MYPRRIDSDCVCVCIKAREILNGRSNNYGYNFLIIILLGWAHYRIAAFAFM